jgi:hypothetical protein
MLKKSFFALLALVSILFIGCNDTDDTSSTNNPTDNFSENFGSSASRNFIGQIVDVDNHPVSGVTVSIGSASVQTDVNGVFKIDQAAVHSRFAYITAHKNGFIDGSRSLVPVSGANMVKIMLLPDVPTEIIQSGVTSEVTIYSGTKVVFDGAFKDESGAAYSGDVKVSLFHLTPSDPNLSSLMPGMLYAEGADGDEKTLQTFGMLQVELRGSGGQKLQIADGHTAEITIRIDDSQMATAPSTIPLWHFDDENGYWKEDGFATRQGNKYIGEVSHFSWWNCDAPFPTVTLTATITDNNGNPISNLLVEIDAGTAYNPDGYTNPDGQVSGLVPSNTTMTINIINQCGIVIQTETVGPFSADTDLGTIVLDNAGLNISTISGTLKKCDETNVTNGYVVVNYLNMTNVIPVTDGAFETSFLSCGIGDQFTFEGVDYDALQSSGVLTFNADDGNVMTGNILVCNAVSEFISYQIDGNPTVFLIAGINANQDANYFFISASDPASPNGFSIFSNTTIPGTYSSAEFSVYGSAFSINPQMPNDVVFQLTDYGNPGEYIDLTFSGTYFGSDSLTHTITGTAHVIRNN